jgi:hypothetical protein
MKMTMRSLLAAVATLCLLAIAAGCGAATETGSGGSLAPASARAVAEIDGNLESSQWEAARGLIDRFPDGDKLLEKLREIDGAAGDRIVVVALDDHDALVLTQPDDASKLRSFVDEYHLVSREIEGWTAIAEDAGTLDAYERALEGGTLEGDAQYEAARDTFPDEALATLYASGHATGDWTALALTAEDDGFRVAGHMKTAVARRLQPIDQEALAEVPGDALAVLAFGGGDLASQLPDQFGLGMELRPILDALSGGAVIWVSPGIPIPEVTVILPNGDSALVDQLLQTFAGKTPEDTTLDGQPAKRIRTGPVTITYAEVDGRLVLTTGSSLHGSGGLEDDEGFQAARDKAGLPDPTDAFLYVDVQRISALVGLLGATGAVPPELARNLEHLDWLYLAAGGQSSDQQIGAFLAIR